MIKDQPGIVEEWCIDGTRMGSVGALKSDNQRIGWNIERQVAAIELDIKRSKYMSRVKEVIGTKLSDLKGSKVRLVSDKQQQAVIFYL